MKKTPSPAQTVSPVETQALNTSQQQQQLQQGALNTAGATAQSALGPVNRLTQVDATGQTPLRRALSSSLTSSTNQAYNNAEQAGRLQALSSGLQNQPLTLGNQTALENQRAGAVARIPSEVEQQATPLELQGAGLENQIANTQLGVARTYNPESYFGAGASMEDQRQNALNQQYQQQQQQNAGLWGGLAKAGLGLIKPFSL